ncbi:hypothetical protein CHU98_g8919 [Xylaria longipes]|nr:hypothetical protein CHU98_g8919 [Xylaria longipes]
MEPQSQLRHARAGSSQPPTDHYQHNPSEAESSEDDDDIPACKLPSISPSKRFTAPSTRSHANQAKRSLSDAGLGGGIVLYPGSKKPRNGYNMTPVSRKSLPCLVPSSPRAPVATVRTPSHARSLTISSEDEICDGLVSSVNDAFRHRQTQDYMEQRLRQARPLTANQLDQTQSGVLEEYGIHVDDQDGSLPLAIPTSLISCALPPNSGNLNGLGEDVKRRSGAAPDEEHQTETEVQIRVDTVSLPRDDVWEVPKSPGEPNAPEDNPDATHQNLQPAKKRGRPPKFPRAASMAELLPNSEPDTGKRKQGRPRKHYPRLRNETDKDYITRIARLRKKSIPCVLEPDAHLAQNSQDNDAHASTCVPSSIQGQGSHGLPQSCHQTASSPDNSQLSQNISIRLEVEPEEDDVRPENHAGPSVRDGNLDERNGDFENNDNLAQYKAVECDDNRSTDSATLSDSLDGFDTDPGSDQDVDQSGEDSFKHDVDVFNTRHTRRATDDEVFEGPSDDDVLAIHLDHLPLRQLCKLLGHSSWAGARGNWQWQYFDYDGAETTPARALLSVLAKLERLYKATPKAPNLKAQNRFLREHTNMLGYYFHKIKILVEHIRTRRLEIPERTEATHKIDSRKRKRMTRDLVLYVIPMLTHVLTSAWGLGGETWSKTSFTGAAVELLERTLGWIMRLHHRLLGELERCPLEEEPEKNHHRQQAWRRRNAKREEIAPLLDDLFQVIAAAPERLAETEAHAKRELQRERQLKIEQKAAEEARQAAVAERKKRSLLSIHGIHYRLGTPITTSRPSPSLTLGSTEWSVEEQRLLFTRIQASYPVCPDLNILRWELNKTAAQTVAMTEHILGKMLTKVLAGYSTEERTAELRRIMRSSGVAGL